MIKVSLPKSNHSQTIHKKEINLTVTDQLKYFVNNAEVSFNDLESQLRKEITRQPDAVIMLRFDSKLTVQELVDVLVLGNKLNIKMVLATKKVAK